MRYEIKERYEKFLILAVEADSFKQAVESAVNRHVDLSRSNLAEADLSESNLYAADFSGALITAAAA